ncbi:hypothetical protein [Salinimicrobium sp. HB62]|uniref:hypothetical protein n=1 Tax=Salinimicrobium sp. HB62 TaxID=3077781 RepID=UPI002D775EFC|nr:hypothetical protein [Salinimicrobium sp. HB62]
MLKKIFIPAPVVLLLLLLLWNSNGLLAATVGGHFFYTGDEGEQQELAISSVGEQVDEVFDPIIPFNKNLVFLKHGNTSNDFEFYIRLHTKSSTGYIQRSRNISPGLGLKEVIFPFHVFL